MQPGYDKTPVVERLKNFNAKSTRIYIPDKLYKEVLFLRELDYFLTFMKNLNTPMAKYENRFYPFGVLQNVQKKINSLSNTYHNIDKAVVLSERG